MIIYFAIEQCLIDRYGLSETETSGQYNWELNYDSFICDSVRSSAGDVLNAVKNLNEKYPGTQTEPFAICKAEISDKEFAEVINGVLSGAPLTLNVKIVEMTWIK